MLISSWLNDSGHGYRRFVSSGRGLHIILSNPVGPSRLWLFRFIPLIGRKHRHSDWDRLNK
jgi:hypothetical protein